MSTGPGDVLAHYRLEEKLGEGGMGIVYRATDTRLNRSVAIKILPADLTADRERRLRFQREAQTAAALNHPAIATIHQVDEQNGTDFIVMEFVQGRTLRAALAERALTLKEWLRVATALAEAVAHAHRNGVIHRDLKPENVMIGADGRVKVLDFGLARLAEPPAPGHAAHALHDDLATISRELTLSGKVFGTVPYMSPEQVRGERADERSDLFSLGAILYEMASGRGPFRAKTDIETLHGILNVDPPPLGQVAPAFPPEAERIVRKALEKEPERRYQHADDLAADLRNLVRDIDTGRVSTMSRSGALPGAADGASTASSVRPGGDVGASGAAATSPAGTVSRAAIPALPGGRRRLAITAGVVAVLVVAAMVTYRLRRPDGTPGTPAIPPPPGAPASDMLPTGAGGSPAHSLAIMYFENMREPDDPQRLGQMVTSLLITDLSESHAFHVMSRQHLFDVLRLLGREDARTIDRTVASDVARKAGVTWILTGSILQTDPTYVIAADVSDARSGEVIASRRISAPPGASIFDAVDRLSAEIRNDLGPADTPAAQTSRPVTATTRSPEAYREYLAGLDATYKLINPDAVTHFRRAAELDSTFAMAHAMLAMNLPSAERDREIELALRHADHATPRESALIRAVAAERAGRDAEAENQLIEATRRWPDDELLLGRLASLYRSRRERTKEIEVLKRLIAVNPQGKLTFNLLAYAYDEAGDVDRSIEAINQYIALAPAEANPYDTRGDLYLNHGRVGEAMDSFREALRRNPTFYPSQAKLAQLHIERREYAEAERLVRGLAGCDDRQFRSVGRSGLAMIPIFQGRLERAVEVARQGIATDDMEGILGGKRFKLGCIMMIHVVRNEPEQAVAVANEIQSLYPALDPQDPLKGRDALFTADLLFHRVDDAAAVLSGISRDAGTGNPVRTIRLRAMQGAVASARGDSTTAIRLLRETESLPVSSLAFWTGYCYMQMDRNEDAVKAFERCLTRYDDDRPTLGVNLILAHYYLARAYEQSGWNDKAAAQYREFLAYWGDGDAGLDAVADAKARLAKLAPGT